MKLKSWKRELRGCVNSLNFLSSIGEEYWRSKTDKSYNKISVVFENSLHIS
jgi:hypothetical protein